jgi:hypothetical protein
MATPMIGAERRLTRRAQWINDIILEPNNGGIVLNVSEGGLCFHSIDSVQQESPIRFSLSLHNQQIEAAGEVAWLDATGRTGGLRFTTLPAEIHEEIRRWVNQPAESVATNGTTLPLFPSVRSFPVPGVGVGTREMARSTQVVSQELTAPAPLKSFSGGLAVGLFISALVTAALLFPSYRRQFGDSIIEFGEQVAARPKPQSRTGPPIEPAASLSPQSISSDLASIPVAQQPESVVPQAMQNPGTLENANSKRIQPPPTTPVATPASIPRVPPSGAPTWPTPPPLAFSSVIVAPNSYLIPSELGPSPPLAPVSPPGIDTEFAEKENAVVTSAMYFEIGKFKDESSAKGTTTKLTQLGFPTAVTQKGRLWMNFYYALVGPYNNDREAKGAHKSLVSHGFKPRPFERGSRYFTLSSGLAINGKHMPVGECTIRWESYSSDVIVQFVQDNAVIATVDGKWVKREERYNRGAIAYTRNRDGSRNLREIRFVGMNRALVF